MANEINNKPTPDQIDRILVGVEKMLDKKIESDIRRQRRANRLQYQSTIGGYLAVAITLGVGASGIVADAYLKNRDRDEQTLREANHRKLEIIAGISGAITFMRELKDIALTYCNEKISPEYIQELKVDRVKRRFELVKAARPRLHFFSDTFRKLLIDFLAWEESITDYCALSAPSEKVWREKQKAIESQMVLAPIQLFVNN